MGDGDRSDAAEMAVAQIARGLTNQATEFGLLSWGKWVVSSPVDLSAGYSLELCESFRALTMMEPFSD